MAKRIDIEISGHKAWIEHVTPQIAGGTLHPWEDRLCILLTFEESVNSILGFYVYLPAVLYEKDEFLRAVKAEGEKELEAHLRQRREEWAKRTEEEKKKKALDRIAEQVRAVIGLQSDLSTR